MNTRFLLGVAASALSMGAVSTPAQQPPRMTVSVPFDFHFGKETLPAGRYYVADAGIGQHDVKLTGETKSSLALVECPLTTNKPSDAKLVFHKVGGIYFLSQVWDANGQGKQLPLTRQEKQLSRHEDATQLALSAN
jgi:hypothetical protein